jgi:DNA-binding NarL/FixJ family response regulator
VLEAFRRLLEPRCDVVGSVTDGRSLIEAADLHRPDLILVDVSMPQLNGLDACERIRQRLPGARLIVLTMTEDPDTAAEAIRRGASGYLLKSSPARELFEAIEHVLGGRTYVSPAVADGPTGVFVERAHRQKTGGLSLREREVLQLLAEGRSMKDAAGMLGVTPRTIAFHKYTMMQRLGLRTGAELVQHAMVLGLVARRPPVA